MIAILEPALELQPGQPMLPDDFPLVIGGGDLEYTLGQINSNGSGRRDQRGRGPSMSNQPKSKFDQPQDEPLFMAVSDRDPEMQAAQRLAASTIAYFKSLVTRDNTHICCAKLRFRDPDSSEQLGEDRFCFIWLNNVNFHQTENLFSGTFFEVPPEFTKWHQVGQRLAFEGDDIFDWMVHDEGHVHGGFTLRVARQKLQESERASYDHFVGAEVWEPLPSL